MSLTIDLSDRVVLVTGATGGIGTGIARRFHTAGATVAVHYRSDATAGHALTVELSGAAAFAGDLTDPTGPQDLVSQVTRRLGGLDVLVNNAGIQPVAELAEMDDTEWTAMIDTNLTAVHRLTQAAASVMGEGGSIVHIASIEGSQPSFGHGHYSVSKAAVIMHAKAASLEWGRRGIRVNTVSPGLIGRDGIETQWPEGVERWRSAAPLQRLGTPEEIGDACVFLASDLASWITGIDLVVDGGVSTHPTW